MGPQPHSTGDVLVYDGTCELGQTVADWVSERSDGSIDFRPATPELARDLGLDDAELDAAAVLVTADGRHLVGALALGEALRRSPRYDRRLLGRLLLEQPSREVGSWIYSWVAKNRHRLSGGAGADGRAA
ncbi:MAG: DCC1-like thiol-disulfide oxidoreductase family protein [Propionibacteriales bacterium]|nr:DCC1-like thiol-disulfide oxidoreductase family protein [Propionibacteriales bacterium]